MRTVAVKSSCLLIHHSLEVVVHNLAQVHVCINDHWVAGLLHLVAGGGGALHVVTLTGAAVVTHMMKLLSTFLHTSTFTDSFCSRSMNGRNLS